MPKYKNQSRGPLSMDLPGRTISVPGKGEFEVEPREEGALHFQRALASGKLKKIDDHWKLEPGPSAEADFGPVDAIVEVTYPPSAGADDAPQEGDSLDTVGAIPAPFFELDSSGPLADTSEEAAHSDEERESVPPPGDGAAKKKKRRKRSSS